jgi:hypothetical protein
MLLAGCRAQVRTRYEPHKAEYQNGVRPVLNVAVEAHRGDIDALGRAGAEVIGTMQGSGNRFARQHHVAAQVAVDAAELGATHIVVAREDVDSTPVFLTNCYGGVCTTSTVAVELPRGAYLLVRVPPKRWSELPKALRPHASHRQEARKKNNPLGLRGWR